MSLGPLSSLLGSAALGSVAYAEDQSAGESAPLLPPIVVSADPLMPSILEFNRPASVLAGQALEERTQSTLGETVDLQPGVRSSFFGPGASRPIIRGLGGERVRTLRNGVSTGDVSSFSEDHVVVADPLQADQVEILRGPETLLYGSSAIGGAINVTDESIPEFSLTKPFEGSILGQFGNSADNEKSESLKLKGAAGPINWYFSAFSRMTDSYEIPGDAESRYLREAENERDGGDLHGSEEHDEHHHPDEGVGEILFDDDVETPSSASGGVRPIEIEERAKSSIVRNTQSETWGGTIGTSYVFDRGFVGGSISGFDSQYGVPGHEHGHADEHESEHHGMLDDGIGGRRSSVRDSGYNDGGSTEVAEDDSVRIEAQQVRGDLRGRIRTDGLIESVAFRVGASDYEHTEFEGQTVGTEYKKDLVEGRLELRHRPWGSVSGVLGLHTIYEDFSAAGDEAFLPPTDSLTQAMFLYSQAKVTDSLTGQWGVRLESVHHDSLASPSFSQYPVSASGGFLWRIDNKETYTVSTSLAYAERAASPVELFADGIHFARRIRELGDPSLTKERSTGIDVAFRKNAGFLTASITPYFQYFYDYINLHSDQGPGSDFPLFRYGTVGASFWGGEFVSSLHFEELTDLRGHRFALDFQSDLVRTRNRDTGGYIPRTPPLRNIVRARWELPQALQFMVEGVFVDSQRRLSADELPTDGYQMVNSEVSYSLPASLASLRLFIRGTNLTNQEARVHSSFLKDLAPLRGRSFLFGLRGTF